MAAATSTPSHINLLNNAVAIANAQLSNQLITARFYNPEDGKSTVLLYLAENKEDFIPIGVIHVVNLIGDDWDKIPYHDLTRDTNDIAQSILKAIDIHNSVKDENNVLLTKRGVPFFTNGHDIKIDNSGYLVIDGEIVTTRGNEKINKISADCILAEERCYFIKLENGHYKITDNVDKRTKKGMFIDLQKVIYRA